MDRLSKYIRNLFKAKSDKNGRSDMGTGMSAEGVSTSGRCHLARYQREKCSSDWNRRAESLACLAGLFDLSGLPL